MELRYLRKPCEEFRHLSRINAIVSQPCPWPKGHRRQLHWVMWRYELGLPLFFAGDCQERVEVCSEARLRPRRDADGHSAHLKETPLLPGFTCLGGGKHRRGRERVL